MYGEKYDSFGGWYISTEISRKTKGAINAFHEMGRQCKEVSGMILSLLMIGFYFIFPQQLGSIFMLVFFLFYVFCCAISISAVVFVLLSEMYPNNVRGIAMSIAGLALWVGTYLIGQLTPWLLANVPPFAPVGTFFLFALMCIPYLLIMWKLVPETTGKSLEEIERWWTGK